jgi:8-oxo-dGTP pyrophosphatase MutT (NUDIX family)
MTGSSILPVAIHKNKLYFLFGKENEFEDSAKGFSDFGGGIEKGETPLDTAIREGGEELTGFLGDVKKLLPPQNKLLVLGDPQKYIIHILPFKYDPNLPTYYNNNHSFLWERMDKRMLSKTKLFEKIEINWFSLSQIRKRIKEFRPFYQEILKQYVLTAASKIRAAIFARKTQRRRPAHGRRRRRTAGH